MSAAGNAGTPQAPTVIWSEDFQNTTVTPNAGTVAGYVGTDGTTYTSDAFWGSRAACNGLLVSNLTTTFQAGDCANDLDSRNATRTLADALGQHEAGAAGSADRANPTRATSPASQANVAVTAYTSGNGTADQRVIETSSLNLPVTRNAFLAVSIDVAEMSCHPGPVPAELDLFATIGSGAEQRISTNSMVPCTDPNSRWYAAPPFNTSYPDYPTAVASYYFDEALMVTPAEADALRIAIRDQTGVGGGNDFAFDNLRILDATPALDVSLAPAAVRPGGVTTVVFTFTNTSDLLPKPGISFTDALPSGVVIAPNPNFTSTCTNAALDTGAAGGSTIAAHGSLDQGMASCTISVDVTPASNGTFTFNPGDVSGLSGATPPNPITLQAIDVAPRAETFQAVATDAGGRTASILTSDLLDGRPVDPADVNLTIDSIPSGLTYDSASHGIVIAPGTAAGTYTVTYTICAVSAPAVCASQVESVTVTAASVATTTTAPPAPAPAPAVPNQGGLGGASADADTPGGSAAPTGSGSRSGSGSSTAPDALASTGGDARSPAATGTLLIGLGAALVALGLRRGRRTPVRSPCR